MLYRQDKLFAPAVELDSHVESLIASNIHSCIYRLNVFADRQKCRTCLFLFCEHFATDFHRKLLWICNFMLRKMSDICLVAGNNLRQFCNLLRKIPCNVIFQAVLVIHVISF